MKQINKFHTLKIKNLITPNKLIQKYPISQKIEKFIEMSRSCIKKILSGKDKRLLVIIGPCSIHDIDSTIEYARRLLSLRRKYNSRLEIVMRTHFEKPRTIVGWKGFISDPNIDNSYHINYGIELARKLLLEINELGIPTATEFLNVVNKEFFSDLISWAIIGARTVESQIHREMASSLSYSVGFKNSTNGNVYTAINAIRSACTKHVFLSPDKNGKMAIFRTNGNHFGNIIMRGGRKPNYYANDLFNVCNILHKFNLLKYLVIDFSHDNCQKDYRKQLNVCDNVCKQIKNGSTVIAGVMIESFIKGGSQKIFSRKDIIFGKSITDSCLGWEDSRSLLEKLNLAVESRF